MFIDRQARLARNVNCLNNNSVIVLRHQQVLDPKNLRRYLYICPSGSEVNRSHLTPGRQQDRPVTRNSHCASMDAMMKMGITWSSGEVSRATSKAARFWSSVPRGIGARAGCGDAVWLSGELVSDAASRWENLTRESASVKRRFGTFP